MFWQRFALPENPPELKTRVKVSRDQVKKATKLMRELSRELDGFPVVLSQFGNVVSAGGLDDDPATAQQLAKAINRSWTDGQERLAREIICFEEEIVGAGKEQTSFRLYSIHVLDALTLTVGWQLSVSLTQLRAEVSDMREKLLDVFS